MNVAQTQFESHFDRSCTTEAEAVRFLVDADHEDFRTAVGLYVRDEGSDLLVDALETTPVRGALHRELVTMRDKMNLQERTQGRDRLLMAVFDCIARMDHLEWQQSAGKAIR